MPKFKGLVSAMNLLIHDYAGHPFQVQLSRELARRGHLVTHAFAGGLQTPRGALNRRLDDPKTFESIEVPMSLDYLANKYSFLRRRNHEVQYGKELVKLVERLKPDLVVSGNTPTEPQWAFTRAVVRKKASMVVWLQDFYSIAVDKLARRKLPVIGTIAGQWYRHLDAQCFQKSKHVIAITEDFKPILKTFGVSANKVTVIPNWAPLDELPLRSRTNPWSNMHGLDGRFVFHYSGTLAMKHNPDLLRQLALRFRHDSNVRIVVVSEGPGADYLARHKVADGLSNLILLPFQAYHMVPDMLAASEVLIAVLEPEAGIFSVPSKVLTYHCAQRPILGAIPRENLAARIITEQNSGICVDPGDPVAFVNAASVFRNRPKECRERADRGRAYAIREFDLNRIADRFEEVFSLARVQN